MPGSVSVAAPTTVLPSSLCRSFSHARDYPVAENEYQDGGSQRGRLADTSRKRWKTSRRLTPTILAQFRSFYDARNGPHQPFYFYDPFDSEFTYDPTGVQTTGRYTVRFEGTWEQMCGMGRGDAELALVEIA